MPTERKTYSEKLRDPRWQRKRLEVFHRENFTCEKCGATEKTLNVHHEHYVRGKQPWEYDSATLRCLCEDCHASTTAEDMKNIFFICANHKRPFENLGRDVYVRDDSYVGPWGHQVCQWPGCTNLADHQPDCWKCGLQSSGHEPRVGHCPTANLENGLSEDFFRE